MVDTATKRRTATLAAAAVIVLTTSCSDHREYPGHQADYLPTEAVGAVVVGPLAMESVSEKDRSMLFFTKVDVDVICQSITAT